MHNRLLILVVLGFLIETSDAKEPDQNKSDLDQMQGTWRAVARESKGKVKGADEVKKFQLIVKKDALTVKVDGEDHVTGKLVLKADKKPKELDLVQETGPVYKGIYEVDGNTLKMCVCMGSDADSERPKEFTTNEHSNYACMTWDRMQ